MDTTQGHEPVVTLTPNPSVDRSIAVDVLRPGQVHRAEASRVDPGGKGVNVSRALAAQGGASVAVLPVGGPEGHLLEELLTAATVEYRSVPVTGTVRMNLTVLEPDGATTKLNEPGPTLTQTEVERLLAVTIGLADGASWVAGCGSLPPGTPSDFYGALVAGVRARGGRVAIDSSGIPMTHAVTARPDLVKPNREELEEIVGRGLVTFGDVRGAALDLVVAGIDVVAVSLGADGALLVTAEDVVHARATITAPVSTVGAGDCMLAGLLNGLATGLPPARALAAGVRWGAAAVTLPGSRVPGPEDLPGIPVELTESPDLSTVLSP